MRTVTIKSKMSNSGSIYDLASEHYDRVIKFRSPTRYAVVKAAYYGGRGYTTHATEEAAATESHRRRDYSHVIIDCMGNKYTQEYGRLRADGVLSEPHVIARYQKVRRQYP